MHWFDQKQNETGQRFTFTMFVCSDSRSTRCNIRVISSNVSFSMYVFHLSGEFLLNVLLYSFYIYFPRDLKSCH